MSLSSAGSKALDMSSDQLVWMARAGYASRGVVYLIIGFFALLAAIGSGEAQGSKGALEKLMSQPAGAILIVAMIIGLIGYVVWRLIQAIGDADQHGTDAKGLAIRGGLLVSALTYTALAIFAATQLGIVTGSSDSGSGGGGGGFAQTVGGFIGSQWVATGLSIIFVCVGIAHWYKALTGKFKEHFAASEDKMKIITPISTIGLCARGTVFFILAFMLFYRGLTAGEEGGSTPGMKDALKFIQELPMGDILLGAMAVGIGLFALYSFCEAIWRKVDVEEGA
ncbi:MAG: hypothetical protein CML31_10950 [Rhizobiales bacterium]|nr:hypothetical protein [Hyphomicrobiales bacterium]